MDIHYSVKSVGVKLGVWRLNMAEKEEMMFEGIGNELIWTCGFLLVSGIVFFVFLLGQEENEQEVHPQQVNIIT